MISQVYRKLFVFLGASAITVSSYAADYLVDKGGTGDFTSIQTAINAASGGDKITVIDTTNTGYIESVEVNKSNLVIVSTTGVNIQQQGAGHTFSFNGIVNGAFGIAPNVTGTKIQGFAFNGGTGSGSYGVWIETNADNTIVRENTFNGSFQAAIGSNHGADGTLTGLVITQNTISDYDLTGIDLGSGVANFSITQNTIVDSTIGAFNSQNIKIFNTGINGLINFNNLLGTLGKAINDFGLFLDGFLLGDLDATSNWWNVIGGPRPVGSGALSGNVLTADNLDPLASEFFFGGPVNGSTGPFVFIDPPSGGPNVIPEPASIAMLGLGSLLLLRRRRRTA